jgi:hypothetical protein
MDAWIRCVTYYGISVNRFEKFPGPYMRYNGNKYGSRLKNIALESSALFQ